MHARKLGAMALGLCLGSAFIAPQASRANSLEYDFTYTGIQTNAGTPDGTTAVGSGSFVLTFSQLGQQTGDFVSAFSFTDTITTPSTSSTYTYGLSDVDSETADLTGSAADPTFATLIIGTDTVNGTPVTLGLTDFTLEDSSGVVNDSTNGDFTQTSGPGTVTFVGAVVPEPATMGLLGGALSLATLRRWRRGR